MIEPEHLYGWEFPEIEQSYGPDEVMLYALSIGVGADPMDEQQLRFVNDTKDGLPLALPTMVVVLGFPGSWMADPRTGIDFSRIVHGEEGIQIHQPLRPAGTVIARHKVVDIVDKGPGRGAVITYDKDLFDKESGDHLATVSHTTFARGDGGFSGEAQPAGMRREPSVIVPDRPPDRLREIRILPQQALLYRLLADRNPLHSDPTVAAEAGFKGPILHGLCTFGMAGYAIIADWCAHDPSRLRSLRSRFSAPVYPGDTLVIESFAERGQVQFQARTRERGNLVLSSGLAEISTIVS